MWLSFAPIPSYTAKYYNVEISDVDWFSVVYFIVSLLVGFVSIGVLDTFGLKVSVGGEISIRSGRVYVIILRSYIVLYIVVNSVTNNTHTHSNSLTHAHTHSLTHSSTWVQGST